MTRRRDDRRGAAAAAGSRAALVPGPHPATERRLCRTWSAAWRPKIRRSPSDWAAAHLRIPAQSGAQPGRYDIARSHAYCRGVLEAAADPNVERIVMQWATQTGKTTLLQAILAYYARNNPLPAMLGTPDRDATIELRDRFYQMAEATPALRRRIPPKRLRNTRVIDLLEMVVHLAWSGNPQRLSGKACGLVLCTELDRWRQPAHEGRTAKLISERVKAFYRSLIIYEGTPTDELSAIALLYEQSDRRRYLVPCPHCGHFQELRFFPHKEDAFAGRGGIMGLQTADGKWLPPHQAHREAWYACEQKGCRIESDDKPGMVRRGVWCPAGQTVDRRGRLQGKPEQEPRTAGFYLNSLYGDALSFGRVAAEYLDSREDAAAMQSFLNNWLALRYSRTNKQPQWKRIGRRLAAGHRRGTVPAGAYFLTAGMDVQEDHVYWVVRAWGAGGTSWLVDWGSAYKRIDQHGQSLRSSDLDQLDELVMERPWPVAGGPTPWGFSELFVMKAAIDSRHRTSEVHEWKLAHPGDRLRLIEGIGEERAARIGLYRSVERDRNATTGEIYKGLCRVWQINVSAYKEDVRDRWEAPLDKPGAWFLPDRVLDEGPEYLRQICNEVPVTERNEKTGHPVRRWKVIDHRLGEHYWDCEVYARAAADMVTEGDFSTLDAVAGETPPAAPKQTDDRPGRIRRFQRRRRG